VLSKKSVDRLYIERQLWHAGLKSVCGLDEVGRGSLAGPVMAAAVIFRENFYLTAVNDSKQLNRKQRKELKIILCQEAVDWNVGRASVAEIDLFNIRIATFMAMRRALNGLRIKVDYLLVDGENINSANCPAQGIVKGDQKSFTIAAASIIAKEIRDEYMEHISEQYPVYCLEKNKGYGTKEHFAAIIDHGASSCHRRSFLKKLPPEIELL
jgi:ribonuclease HII